MGAYAPTYHPYQANAAPGTDRPELAGFQLPPHQPHQSHRLFLMNEDDPDAAGHADRRGDGAGDDDPGDDGRHGGNDGSDSDGMDDAGADRGDGLDQDGEEDEDEEEEEDDDASGGRRARGSAAARSGMRRADLGGASYRSESPTTRQNQQQRELLSEDTKRQNHINSEKKRRQNIREAFQTMTELVPSLRRTNYSKATILHKANEYISSLQRRLGIADQDGRIIRDEYAGRKGRRRVHGAPERETAR